MLGTRPWQIQKQTVLARSQWLDVVGIVAGARKEGLAPRQLIAFSSPCNYTTCVRWELLQSEKQLTADAPTLPKLAYPSVFWTSLLQGKMLLMQQPSLLWHQPTEKSISQNDQEGLQMLRIYSFGFAWWSAATYQWLGCGIVLLISLSAFVFNLPFKLSSQWNPHRCLGVILSYFSILSYRQTWKCTGCDCAVN